MTPYWKGLLKLIFSVYLIWHVGVFFSFFPFLGHNKAVGYGTMISCVALYSVYNQTTKNEEKKSEKSQEE